MGFLQKRLMFLLRTYINALIKSLPSEFGTEDTPWPDEEFFSSSNEKPHATPTLNARLKRCYNRLEIPLNSDLPTVRNAWKTMMKRYHPDHYANDPEKMSDATKLCQELTEAYLELSEFLKNR